MSTKVERALTAFQSGFNCAQSVLSVFCDGYGLDQETALKMTCGLSAGFRAGEICGAAAGAVLVVGLKYGQSAAEDTQSKTNCHARTVEFLDRFRAKNSSVVCREILGCELSTPEGYEYAKNHNLISTVCVEMIRSAVSLLEELGY